MKTYTDVATYIDAQPKEIQSTLKKLRATIKKLAPKAEESVSYGMPAYKLNKIPLVYFAAFKNHIGFYPTPNGVSSFKKELSKYKLAKATVQFPHGEPLPWGLIRKIVKFRIKECQKKTK